MSWQKNCAGANGLRSALALVLILSLLLCLPAASFAEEPDGTPLTEGGVSNTTDQPQPTEGGVSNTVDQTQPGEGNPNALGNDSGDETPAAGMIPVAVANTVDILLTTGLEPPAPTVTYDYTATLYNPESGDYPGVYCTEALVPNEERGENDPLPTIGAPSIADDNLMDAPTTESPAIIQGAAVGYEEKTGPTEYTPIEGRPTPPDPYSEFRVKVMEEQGTDGTTHQKLSGFDGTYVIYRLDMSNFLSPEGGSSIDNLYLHMKQEDNKALMPAMGLAEGKHEFTDGLGNRTGAYALSELMDGGTPYLDVILYATAANVAGADAGKENVANGDVPLSLYVDSTADYAPELTTYDPQSTDPNQDTKFLAKFFDTVKAGVDAVSKYLVKGSDLALEVSVEDSAGENRDSGTTYWSLTKSFQEEYYDQEIDSSPDDPGCGRTIKMMSEVAVTGGLDFHGTDENMLRKRTLDVNSFDVQVANNTTTDPSTYTAGVNLKNAWLTIEDQSNTTGAEVAIGNNATFVIDSGATLIIDDTCQLEIEWDGATTTAPTDGTPPAEPPTLNNGLLDLRAGGKIVNNGIITIEGTEGKPVQPGQEPQPTQSEKGFGEFTVDEGATLTNNGALVIYGKFYNLGTLVNNGRYNDVIKSVDPDKGAFDYHKGIQVAWKDDVTQQNVVAGTLFNGKDREGNLVPTATLVNNGDIVLTPGTLENNARLENARTGGIFAAAVTEAIIPIQPDPANPTVVSKRITLAEVKTSEIINNGTLVNDGMIVPATVALNDNIGFGALSVPGLHPELFSLENNGTIINNGLIYVPDGPAVVEAFSGSDRAVDDTWLYLYEDGSFRMVLADGSEVTGSYRIDGDRLVFTLADGTEIAPEADGDGNWVYSIQAGGKTVEFVLSAELVARVNEKLEKNETPDKIQLAA